MATLHIEYDRDLYLRGLIDLAEFERRVGDTMQILYEQVVWQAAQKRAREGAALTMAGPL